MFDPSRPNPDPLQRRARDYAWYMVNGELGRSELDPVYIHDGTEGRDQGAARGTYSSCGDLVHGLWFHVGCRSNWVNRKANGTYKVGQNISKICYTLPNLGRRTLCPTSLILAGDAMIIWERPDTTDAHTFVCLDHDPGAGILLSADFGQPGGALRRRKLVWERIGGIDVAFLVGKTKKRVRVWAPLDCVIDVAKTEGKFEERDTDPAPPEAED
jgi:hypothetical protein